MKKIGEAMNPFTRITVTVAVFTAAAAHAQVAATQAYDVVIRHRKVLDGAGNPWIAGDVAMMDGRFVI